MNHVLIARMNAEPDASEAFNRWYDGEHMRQAAAIPGFSTEHRRYRAEAVSTTYRHFEANPEFTAIYALEPDAERLAAINSDEYRRWSGDFLAQWRERTRDEVSIMCDQVFGREDPLPYKRVMIAQLNISDDQDQFRQWCAKHHLPGAARIPGFGTDHRMFQAIELQGRYWHYRADPMYTILYEMDRDDEPTGALEAGEFRTWCEEFRDRWGSRANGESYTICRRIY